MGQLFPSLSGEYLKASLFIPSSSETQSLEFKLQDIQSHWDHLYRFLNKGETILVKERLEYIAYCLPKIEELSARDFLKEYLLHFQQRFSGSVSTTQVLQAPSAPASQAPPSIPVTVAMDGAEFNDLQLSECLRETNERVYIVGEPGSGKSTLSRRIANHIASFAHESGSTLVPIYVCLSTGILPSLVMALQMSCEELGVRSFPHLFEAHLRTSHVILIMDGLDELTSNDQDNISSLEDLSESVAFCLLQDQWSHHLTIRYSLIDEGLYGISMIENCPLS